MLQQPPCCVRCLGDQHARVPAGGLAIGLAAGLATRYLLKALHRQGAKPPQVR